MTPAETTCKEILANISGYLDGELDATACEAIERHCVTCARCCAIVTGLRQTVGLCRQAGTVPLPDDVRRRARDSVRELLERSGRSHRDDPQVRS
jgi:anti-sigma factor RsiW